MFSKPEKIPDFPKNPSKVIIDSFFEVNYDLGFKLRKIAQDISFLNCCFSLTFFGMYFLPFPYSLWYWLSIFSIIAIVFSITQYLIHLGTIEFNKAIQRIENIKEAIKIKENHDPEN
jgi:hypothetical protein